jgi:hypothetical protein
LKKEVEDSQSKIKSLENSDEALTIELKKKRDKFQNSKKKLDKDLKILKSKTKEKKGILNSLVDEENSLTNKNEELQKEGEILYQLYSKTFTSINNN